jgi:hypothetical protein
MKRLASSLVLGSVAVFSLACGMLGGEEAEVELTPVAEEVPVTEPVAPPPPVEPVAPVEPEAAVDAPEGAPEKEEEAPAAAPAKSTTRSAPLAPAKRPPAVQSQPGKKTGGNGGGDADAQQGGSRRR